MSKWISSQESLPEYGEVVLLRSPRGNLVVGRYDLEDVHGHAGPYWVDAVSGVAMSYVVPVSKAIYSHWCRIPEFEDAA